MRPFLIIFLLNISVLSFSQITGIDSIDNKLNSLKVDSLQVQYLNLLFAQFEFVDYELAENFAKKALEISINSKYLRGKAESYTSLGFINEDIGNYDKALTFYKLSSGIYMNLKDDDGLAKSYNYTGTCYKNIADYINAIEFLEKAMVIFKKRNNEKGIAAVLNNFGITYYAKGDIDKALDNYIQAISYFKAQNNNYGMAATYCNIANIYKDLNKYNEAIEFHLKAIEIDKEIGQRNWESVNYNGLGTVYKDMDETELAKEYFLKALNLREEIGDKYGAATTAANIGSLYMSIDSIPLSLKYFDFAADLFMKSGAMKEYANVLATLAKIHLDKGNPEKALDLTTRAISISRDIESYELKNKVIQMHAIVLEKNNRKNEAMEYYKMLATIKDSLYDETRQNALTEMGIRFDTEQKENKIKLLQKDKEIQDAEINRQRLFRNFFIGIIFLITLIIITLFILFQNKKRANAALKKLNANILQQKEEIEAQRDEIEAQRDEISAQRDMVTYQKKILEEVHEELTDSINYAKRIQEAVLPISTLSRTVLGDHFIMFHPKDIVSGDFYWTAQIEKTLVIAVADCTGHGVPGAFMSMLGISFLNEIIRKKEITKANQVLNELRQEIINALQQKGTSGEQKDGMDISLIAINTTIVNHQSSIVNSYTAQWAGANNPLWVIRNVIASEAKQSAEPEGDCFVVPPRNDGFIETKPDKMPIAIYERMDDFTNHELQLFSGDTIYMMSDGYEDQFGGPKHKKFLSKNLKQLLIENCRLSMKEQKEILEKTLINWIGNGEQIDDITILGKKI